MIQTQNRFGWRTLALSALLLVGAGAAAVGLANAGKAPPPSGGGGDSVGSLPAMGGSPYDGDPSGKTNEGALPRLALIGDEAQVRALIADAAGVGRAVIFHLDTFGKVEVVFFGQVSVWLDRAAVELGNVQVQLEVSPVFGTCVESISISGKTVQRATLPAGDVSLDLAALSNSGSLEKGELRMKLVNAKKVTQIFDITTGDRTIRIDQRH